ncbi:MAG: 5-oxoprolinase/urea amidolyase family protein [Microbacterium ginsengisoli]|nr:5-oxoprolinase/urea amidolyase family protein [Microbacterium ginsengisoli]
MPTLRPMGEAAVLVEVDTLDAALALHASLAASVVPGVHELVPAARTVLVRFDPRATTRAAVARWVTDAAASPPRDAAPAAVTVLEVVYDGDDLDETARLLGVDAPALVAAHTGAEWTVAFTGFAPGFGYLVRADWPFDVPRLDAPRTRVPVGSVGLAGAFSGAYPRATPGGWRLIGRTDAPLFDPRGARPALLEPGAAVRFVSARDVVRGAVRADAAGGTVAEPGRAPGAPNPEPAMPGPALDSARGTPAAAPGALTTPNVEPTAPRRAFEVLRVGVSATLQDLGRPHLAHLGIARSGALDRAALRVANRLVGNVEGDAGIEVVGGGTALRATCDLWVAVTGAWGEVTVDRVPIGAYVATAWPAGSVLEIGWPRRGIRTIVAVRGGVDVPLEAGSRATDTLSALGPAPLGAGDLLSIGADPASPIPVVDAFPWTAPAETLELPVALGPRDDWFTRTAVDALFARPWRVSTDSDRVGMRLDGPLLARTRDGELPSEGMVPGALQVPPSGRPTILLADGPVTGGYPVIGVIPDAVLGLLAQAAPGTVLHFTRR